MAMLNNYVDNLQATVTQHVVLRGNYQTLPIALYGWVHARESVKEVKCLSIPD